MHFFLFWTLVITSPTTLLFCHHRRRGCVLATVLGDPFSLYPYSLLDNTGEFKEITTLTNFFELNPT